MEVVSVLIWYIYICIFTVSQVAELSHSVASPMSFKVEYKRGSSGPAMFQRQVRFQVDISPVPKPQSHPTTTHHSHEREFLYAITFILLSGNIRRFRRICEHVQSQVCSRRPPPPSPRAARKFANSEQLSESSSCGSDTSDRLSPFSNSTNSRQVSLVYKERRTSLTIIIEMKTCEKTRI